MKVFDDFGKGLHLDCGFAPVVPKLNRAIFHMHPQYELLLVWEQTVNTTIINGKSIEVSHPMAVLTAPFTMHHTYFQEAKGESVERCVLYFDEAFLDSFGDRRPPVSQLLGNSGAVILDIRGYEQKVLDMVRSLVDRDKYSGTRGVLSTEMQNLWAAMILRSLYDFSERERSGVRISETNYIIEVMEYIVKNLGENLTIPQIAEHFFISRDKLCRDFRKHTQMNVGDFISTARLNLAKKYLIENKMTIKEISAACGFENDIYFYSFFKRHEGCTPKEFSRGNLIVHPLRRQSD